MWVFCLLQTHVTGPSVFVTDTCSRAICICYRHMFQGHLCMADVCILFVIDTCSRASCAWLMCVFCLLQTHVPGPGVHGWCVYFVCYRHMFPGQLCLADVCILFVTDTCSRASCACLMCVFWLLQTHVPGPAVHGWYVYFGYYRHMFQGQLCMFDVCILVITDTCSRASCTWLMCVFCYIHMFQGQLCMADVCILFVTYTCSRASCAWLMCVFCLLQTHVPGPAVHVWCVYFVCYRHMFQGQLCMADVCILFVTDTCSRARCAWLMCVFCLLQTHVPGPAMLGWCVYFVCYRHMFQGQLCMFDVCILVVTDTCSRTSCAWLICVFWLLQTHVPGPAVHVWCVYFGYYRHMFQGQLYMVDVCILLHTHVPGPAVHGWCVYFVCYIHMFQGQLCMADVCILFITDTCSRASCAWLIWNWNSHSKFLISQVY